MKDRIKEIIDRENLTPTKLAEKLNISRAVISHILNGRNNPSLDVVMSILNEMPYINTDWLISGSGQMYKDGMEPENASTDSDLFVNAAGNMNEGQAGYEIGSAEQAEKLSESLNLFGNEGAMPSKAYARKISQIIIYYDDNTFESFVINKK